MFAANIRKIKGGKNINDKYSFINRYIYVLLDPRQNIKIAYVGQSKDVERRYKEHLRSNSENKEKNKWISELKEIGLKPIVKVEKMICTSQFIAFTDEMEVTIKYRDLGYEILSVRKEKINNIYY